MTAQRRIVIAAAAVLVAVVAGVGLAALLGGGGDTGESVRSDQSSTTGSTAPPETVPAETTTTYDLVPEVTTTAPPRPTSTTGTTAAPRPVVTGQGAVLQPHPSAAARKMTGDDCKTLADGGWEAECGVVAAKGGARLVWLVETRAALRRASVLAPSASGTPGNWRVVLQARDDSGTRWKSVAVRSVDLSGDGGDEIVFGFRAATGGALALDVVEGPGSVVVHRDLLQGVARVSTGQLDTWSGGGGGRFDHELVRWHDGAWRIMSRSQVASGDVPPSQF